MNKSTMIIHNLNILVTRPNPGGTALCSFLKACGASPIHFPTIQFAQPTDMRGFMQSIHSLPDQDWLVFISPQSVEASCKHIRSAWPHLHTQVKLAAVGEGTAKALEAAGYPTVIYPAKEWSSEGLLTLPEFKSVTGKKIAIIRGEGGRTLLANTLTDRGARVTHVIAYRRTLPTALNLNMDKNIHAIIGTSFEAVENLKKLCTAEKWLYIQQIPLIVVSERIKMLAQNLNFQTIWVARNASHEALLEILEGLNYAG